MDSRRRSYTHSNKRVSRKYNKRAYREFKRSWTPHVTIPGQGQVNRRDGIPPSMLQKLRYTGVTEIEVVNTPWGENGIQIVLDPRGIIGAGLPVTHQPSLFDQFMTLYTNYRVRAYKVRVQGTVLPQPPSTNTTPVTAFLGSVVVPPGVAPALVTGYLALSQDPRGKSGLCMRGDAGITTHKHYYSLMSLSGNVDPTDDAYTGSETVNPPLTPTLVIVTKSDGGTSYADMTLQIDIKFYVEFFNPRAVATS